MEDDENADEAKYTDPSISPQQVQEQNLSTFSKEEFEGFWAPIWETTDTENLTPQWINDIRKHLSTQTQSKKITQLQSSSIGKLSIRAYRKRKIGHYQPLIVLLTTGLSYLPCYTPVLPVHFKALEIILVSSRWAGACNSNTRPMSRHFYRLIYF